MLNYSVVIDFKCTATNIVIFSNGCLIPESITPPSGCHWSCPVLCVIYILQYIKISYWSSCVTDKYTCQMGLTLANIPLCEFKTHFHHLPDTLRSHSLQWRSWPFVRAKESKDYVVFRSLIYHSPSPFPVAITHGTMSGLVAAIL